MIIALIILFLLTVGGAITSIVISEDFWATRVIIPTGFLIILIYFFGGVVYTGSLPYEDTVLESYEIVSLNDNDNTNGTFVLGTGSVYDTTYYVYNYKTEDGGIKRDKINTNDATVYETKDSPHIDVIGKKLKGSAKDSVMYHLFNVGFLEDYITSTPNDCKIYISEGSIITEFKIDLE